MSNTVIRTRIDTRIKQKANKLFEKMGLTMSGALRLFLYQSVAENGLPFRINIPNAVTAATLREIKTQPKHLEKTSLAKLEKDWNDARA